MINISLYPKKIKFTLTAGEVLVTPDDVIVLQEIRASASISIYRKTYTDFINMQNF